MAASQVVAVQAVALTAYVEGGIYEQFSSVGLWGQLQSLAPPCPVRFSPALVGLVPLLRRPPRPGPVPWRAPARPVRRARPAPTTRPNSRRGAPPCGW
ncbi:hypothetical protein ACW23B_21250 [Streptomyces albidoflavus]